jgi:hypothetical protein
MSIRDAFVESVYLTIKCVAACMYCLLDYSAIATG